MLDLRGENSLFVEAIQRATSFLEITPSGVILKVNSNFLSLAGGEPARWEGSSFLTLLGEGLESAEKASAVWSEVLTKRFCFIEFSVRHVDGTEIWVTARCYAVGKRSKVGKVFAVLSDNTAARAERFRSKALLSALDKSMGLIEFDVDGKIRNANANFLALTGYEVDEIVGRHHRMFMDPAEVTRPEYAKHWADVGGGQHIVGTFRRIAKDGSEIWIQASYNPLFDEKGRVSGIFKIASDITQGKRADSALKRTQEVVADGVSELARSIASTNQRSSDAASAAANASSNVQAVARGSSELSSSVSEINRQVSTAVDVSNRAVDQVRKSGSIIESLVEDARKISAVADLISSIAAQTNLLALNATIEAARAGEAGRGFAVVAGEVKALAAQTAHATGEINSRIEAVQLSSKNAKSEMEAIADTMSKINDISISISAAVEEQAAVTESMAHNMQDAAHGVEVITQAMDEVASLSRDADRQIGKILEAAGKAA